MGFQYDPRLFWTGLERMKDALQAIAEMKILAGRGEALKVLGGGVVSTDLDPEVHAAISNLFAGINMAERALAGSPDDSALLGSSRDAETDARILAEFINEWKERLA